MPSLVSYWIGGHFYAPNSGHRGISKMADEVNQKHKELESNLTDLTARMTGVETNLLSQSRALDQQGSTLNEIRRSVSMIGKADPKLYVSIILAVVSVVGVIGLVGSMALRPIVANVLRNDNHDLLHEALPAHSKSVANQATVKESITSVRERIRVMDELVSKMVDSLGLLHRSQWHRFEGLETRERVVGLESIIKERFRRKQAD